MKFAMERHYSLRQSARLMGVDRETVKHWLKDIGILLPRVRQGSKVLIRESDITRMVERRRDARTR